jgi:hypothetical protein
MTFPGHALKIFLGALILLLATSDSSVKRHPETEQVARLPSAIHRDQGEGVRQSFSRYANRLKAYHALLGSAVLNQTPGQLAPFAPVAPAAQGYQILPKIIADVTRPTPRLHSSHYSWPATQKLIDDAMVEIGRAEEELKEAVRIKYDRQQGVREQLARTYRRLRERQQNIDAHIQYNRFWQADIVARRVSYDRWTSLYDAVLERQGIRDRLAILDAKWVNKAFAILGRFSKSLSDFKNRLIERKKFLDGMIDAAAGELRVPAFVRVEQRPGAWIIHVPFYTDIDDRDFVASVKKEVESIWRLRYGEDEFRVVLADSYVPASWLYPDGAPPRTGDNIDPRTHLAQFPLNGAILTTGAITTHVDGRAIILGPHEISPRVLAHEFGHILGFKDNYFRGYRDLGENGFEVVEVIAAHDDIMGSPASGEVRQGQFMRLLQAIRGQV